MTQTIERTSPVPYYEQLFDILKTRITAGELPSEERLPSELELCREFGLARATVRQTLSKLETEGYARRVARRGVFATTPQPTSGWIVQDTEGFLESQIRYGRTGIDTTVIDAGFRDVPTHVSEALRLPASGQVFAIERVRRLDGTIAMFSTNWFPPETESVIAGATDVLAGTGSVNGTLRRAGFITEGARRVIHSMGAPAEVAVHLQVPNGHPVLRIRSLSWDAGDHRFEYYETWVLTDVVPLEVNVTAA